MEEIVLRYCGAVGWLGLLMVEDVEFYRTGNHCKTAREALERVELFRGTI